MALREELERQGSFLFRWRSYFPLLTVPLFLPALRQYEPPFQDPSANRVFELVCFFISLSGLAFRTYATSCAPRSTSGRNTKEQAANMLNTTGLYSVVRHPLYVGNFMIWIGIILSLHTAWLTAVTALIYWIYYERIMYAEEEYLRTKFGNTYLEWAQKTPEFFPDWKRWVPPALSFSWKNALRREYSGFFGMIAAFTALEIAKIYLSENHPALDILWIWIFLFGLAAYLTLMFLKKKTRILDVSGR